MAIGKISEFDVKTGLWSSYADRLEMYFKVNKIEEDLKLPTLISAMGDDAYELLVNLASPKKPAELTYAVASDLMSHHLQPIPSVLAERYRFRQRRQRAEENISDYIAELKKLARFCKFKDNLTENLRDQFVCGLKGDLIRQRLFGEDGDLSFGDAVKLATALEAAERDAAAVEVRSALEAPAAAAAAEVHAVQARGARAGLSRLPAWTGAAGSRGGARRDTSAGQSGSCRACGASGHSYGDCRFRNYVCSRCKQSGHLRRMCSVESGKTGGVAAAAPAGRARAGPGSARGFHYAANGTADEGSDGASEDEFEDAFLDLHQLSLKDYKPVSLPLSIDGKIVTMEIDTGTPISCISKHTYDRYFKNRTIHPYDLCLRFYDGSNIRPLGYIMPSVKYRDKVRELELFVVDRGTTSLLGRQWLTELKIEIPSLNNIQTDARYGGGCMNNNINALVDRYKQLFDGSLGRFTGGKATLRVREGAAPVFHRARPLPFALRERVDAELDAMLRAGIIEPVECSDWASPLVPVNKSDEPATNCTIINHGARINVTLAGYGRHTYGGAYHARASAVPLNANGEPIKLPENLESLPRAEHFAAQRHRWNTNEEIAAILISFDKHSEWQSKEVKIRPKSGSMLLYSRKKVRYRRDGYCWKKRKDGKTTREDHMKLKVQGTECIYGCYVHSAILPTFHRRCYWLLQNPDIVLVHYLNVPYPDDNKLATVAPSLALWADKKEWTKDELVSQLKPMFFSEDEPDINSDLEISGKMFQTAETVEAIVGQLMEKQRAARAAALARQLECSCPDSTCQDSRNCTHALRRVQTTKQPPSDHHVSSTTGPSPRPMAHPPRQYTRDHRPAQQTSSPLLLSLGQIQGGGGLLILNGTSSAQSHSSIVSPLSVTSFICEEPRDRFRHQYKPTFVLKRELPEATCIKKIEPLEIENTVQENKIEINFDRKIKMEPKCRTHVVANTPMIPSRYPDLVERLESEVLTKNCDDTLVLLGTDSHLASGFFDETLELSHEDIQKTLSANMPNCDLRNGVRSTETANVMVSGIDTMDFIESCEAVASPTHVVDDNVFVNLDAFDMLGDFPELEVLDPNTISTNPVTLYESHQKQPSPVVNGVEKMQTDCPTEQDQRTLNITDYSPEWAYPEGGAKVLIAGPWTECSDQYTVLFDNFPVPSILVQNGLLRCYCPAHEAGLAALQVARGGHVVSDTVVFEYKAGPTPAPASPTSAPLPSLDFRRFSLLQRLQRLHGRLQVKIEPMDETNQIDDNQLYTNPKFEERLVNFCRSLSARSLGTSEGFTTEPGEDASTVLHLSAALGFTKLTTVLLRWRQDDSSLALEKEVNLGARDVDNNTPLMVASAAGHVETAVVLARWSAGTRTEAGARQAAAAARRAGHNNLANLLDRIHPPTKDGVFLRPNSLSQKGRAGSLESNLVKRPSIDSGINMADAFRSNSAIDKSDGSSARWERSMSLPLDSDTSEDSFGDSKMGRRMDLALCETAPRRAASPLIDVEVLSEPPSPPSPPPPPPPPAPGEQDDRVFTLAEQIIAAMPERIKNESSSLLGCGLDGNGSGGEDTLMTPLLDDTTTFNTEFSFEFCDNTYRYCGGSTPCSSGSVSPGSALSPPPPSPRSALTSHSTSASPPATLQEFLNATTHFSSLTLNDREQRELYSAAITIQKAYRQYRGRQLQRRAAAAAITIQNCYRRYKQFAYLKQMHAAATVIQRGYRSMRARRMASNNAVKRTYSQRRQNQAARKIQQFMRQTKIKLQSVRAENAKAVLLSGARRSSSPRTTNTPPTPNRARVVNYLSPGTPMNADEDLLLELLFKM